MQSKQPWFPRKDRAFTDKLIRGIPTVHMTKAGRRGIPRAVITLQVEGINARQRFLVQGQPFVELVERASAKRELVTFITGARQDQRKQICATPTFFP